MDTHSLSALTQSLHDTFRAGKPYGYAAVGALFEHACLTQVANEVEANLARCAAEPEIYASHRKYRLSRLADMPPMTRSLVEELNAPPFLATLSAITGIADLHPDPELRGGGIHAIGRGGFLKLHTDFNWHDGLGMHRRLNLLLYLNARWEPDWNGYIELWSPDARQRIFSLAPALGNALLFETNDISYHGHPDPLACPEGVFRKSLALYYYTRTRPEEGIVFGRTEMTNFVERPDETFDSDRLRRVRQRLQLRAKRLAHGLFQGRKP